MAEYNPTSDPDVVEKQETTDIDLSVYIQEYVRIESAVQEVQDLTKDVPDQETLQFWNRHFENEQIQQMARLRGQARILYNALLPIYNAGLIPTQYNDELLRLKNFVEGG